MPVDEYLRANRDHWDEVVPLHARSRFYDVAGFRAGRCTLELLERAELGDVAGQSLLHLQCHFGLDTLSWARLGARVTGVDFSKPAIDLARSLSAELGIPAEFVCSDVYGLPDALAGEFDVVYTSYGVLCWLPDLRRWAEVAARYVRPGGAFYIAEFHPFAAVFDDSPGLPELRVGYPYFHEPAPTRFEAGGDYADLDARLTCPTYEWAHSLGDVLNALIGAGLRIEYLREHPFTCYQALPSLERGADGLWRLPAGRGSIPLTYSVRATKPG